MLSDLWLLELRLDHLTLLGANASQRKPDALPRVPASGIGENPTYGAYDMELTR